MNKKNSVIRKNLKRRELNTEVLTQRNKERDFTVTSIGSTWSNKAGLNRKLKYYSSHYEEHASFHRE